MAGPDSQTTSQPGRWWDFDPPASSDSWRQPGKPLLKALIDHVPAKADSTPAYTPVWQPGHEMHLNGQGGIVNKERRHYTIVGHGYYANRIGGCRTLAAGTQSIETEGHLGVTVAPQPDAREGVVGTGLDSLTVAGDADITFHARTLLMSGVVTRAWNGGVMRLASMEGVICGGLFMRGIFGPSLTLSALMTGDVYGGCARVSVVRAYLALLHYRAAQSAAWLSSAYVRSASFVIEPMVSVPSDRPQGGAASKLARMGRTFARARMICPPLDILVGLATLAALPVTLLARFIAKKLGKARPPPMGPPRVRIRNVGADLENWGSIMII